jgi:hypothetical protein
LEGWNIKSIAGYLATTRPRDYDILRRWFAEGLPGLEDLSRAPKHPVRKVDLKELRWNGASHCGRRRTSLAGSGGEVAGRSSYSHWRMWRSKRRELGVWWLDEDMAGDDGGT